MIMTKEWQNTLEGDEWSAVQVGPVTVGWVGPYRDPWASGWADVTILMDDREFPLPESLISNLMAEHFVYEQDQQRNREEIAVIQKMLEYTRCLAVRVPANSLDVSSSGRIVLTTLSLNTLQIALYRFCVAFITEVQAGLHMMPPVEVSRKYAELSHYRYPEMWLDQLTWRGRTLDEIASGTTIQVRSISPRHSHYPYLDLPGPMRFGYFVERQTRATFHSDRVLPENVFAILASSPEEFESVQLLILERQELLQMYLAQIRPTAQDASLFFVLKGDVLEEWIDGEVISLDEFSRKTQKLHTRMVKMKAKANRRRWPKRRFL